MTQTFHRQRWKGRWPVRCAAVEGCRFPGARGRPQQSFAWRSRVPCGHEREKPHGHEYRGVQLGVREGHATYARGWRKPNAGPRKTTGAGGRAAARGTAATATACATRAEAVGRLDQGPSPFRSQRVHRGQPCAPGGNALRRPSWSPEPGAPRVSFERRQAEALQASRRRADVRRGRTPNGLKAVGFISVSEGDTLHTHTPAPASTDGFAVDVRSRTRYARPRRDAASWTAKGTAQPLVP